MKQIIEKKVSSNGGTNFYAIKQANHFIDSNVESVDSIKYLLSDGFHNSTTKYPTKNITNDHIKFRYSLGIGSESNYDKHLLKNMGDNFVQGNDEHDVFDSIIGDTFGAVSIFAKDVEICIYTTANEIKSNKKVESTEYNVLFDQTKFSVSEKANNQFMVTCIDDNVVKINCSDAINFNSVDRDMLFIFYVDISGSMAETITSGHVINHTTNGFMPIRDQNIDAILPDINHTTNRFITIHDQYFDVILPDNDDNLNIVENAKDLNEIEVIIDVSVQENKRLRLSETKYNKFTLSRTDKFNTFNEEYFICDTKEPIYVEIKSTKGVQYFICNNSDTFAYTDNDNTDLVRKFCHLMTKLNDLKTLSHDARKKSIEELSMLVKSPEYTVLKELIDSKNEKSHIDMSYLASINQILRLYSKARLSSNCLDYMISTSDLSIARNVSTGTSRQYSCGTTENVIDTKNITVYDTDSDMCTICTTNPRSVLYDCGHCVACKSCTEQMFFANTVPYRRINNLRMKSASIDETIHCIESKEIIVDMDQIDEFKAFEEKIRTELQNCPKNCPMCRSNIKNMRLIGSVDNNGIKCSQDKCLNFANYVSSDCYHVTYCKICWENKKNKFNFGVNHKMTCPCGKQINKYIEIFT